MNVTKELVKKLVARGDIFVHKKVRLKTGTLDPDSIMLRRTYRSIKMIWRGLRRSEVLSDPVLVFVQCCRRMDVRPRCRGRSFTLGAPSFVSQAVKTVSAARCMTGGW